MDARRGAVGLAQLVIINNSTTSVIQVFRGASYCSFWHPLGDFIFARTNQAVTT